MTIHPAMLQKLNDLTRGKTKLVHGVFHYQCQSCHLIKPMYLGYGVEGPLELVQQKCFIPSPFMGPKCELCDGTTQHVAFNLDQRFEPRVPPAGAFVYAYPEEGLPPETELGSMYVGTRFIAGR